MPFAARQSRTLVRPHPNGNYKGANLIYYPAQGVRSCATGSDYHGLNVAIAWVEWDSTRPLTAVGGFYWQVQKAKALGCNVVRAMQDGGGGSWLGLYAPGQGYAANRAVAVARMVALANYAASLGLYFYPTLNGCSYNGYTTAPNGGGGFGAIADHAAAFAAALKDLPNVIGFDVMQEASLQYGAYGMELQNSGGNPLGIGRPDTAITQSQSWALIRQTLAACRAAAPDLPLTASFNAGSDSSALWHNTDIPAVAPYVDFLDCHVYYDPQPDDLLPLWQQAGASGKPLVVGETGQNYAAGMPAQKVRHASVVSNVVRAVVPGQPGCYGYHWWSLGTQGTSAADDYGAYGIDNAEPPAETGARTVVADLTAAPVTLRQLHHRRFSGYSIGSAAGFTAVAPAAVAVVADAWAGGATALGMTPITDTGIATLADYLPPADACVQARLRVNGTDPANYAAFGVMVRATADGANGYLATCNPMAGAVFVFRKTGGSFATLVTGTFPALAPGAAYWMKVQASGPYLGVKVWAVAAAEPSYFQAVSPSDATYPSGRIGFRAAVTGTPATNRLTVDDLLVGDVGVQFPVQQPAVLSLAAPPAPGVVSVPAAGGTVATPPGWPFDGGQAFTLTADAGTVTVDTAHAGVTGNGTGAATVTPDAGTVAVAYAVLRSDTGSTTVSMANGQGWDDPAPVAVAFAPPMVDPVTLTLTWQAAPYPTAVALASLTRADTGDAVDYGSGAFAADPDVTGRWSVTWEAPAPGLTYAYRAVAAIDGEAVPLEGTYADGGGGGPISAFTTKASARNFGGPWNADAYFTKNGSATDAAVVNANWLQAGQRNDAAIRAAWRVRLRDAGVSYVSLESLLADNPDDAQYLAETSDWGIIFRGYEGRGTFDNGPSGDDLLALDGKMSGLRKRYEQRLADVRSGVALRDMQKAAGVVGILEAQASLAPTAGPATGGTGRAYEPFGRIDWCL